MNVTRKRLAGLAALICLDFVFFTAINPANSPSLVLFAGFAVLAVNLYALSRVALGTIKVLTARPKGSTRRPAIFLTGLVVLLAALQSIGQLTLRDIAAVIALTVLFWFYGSYYRRKQV